MPLSHTQGNVKLHFPPTRRACLACNGSNVLGCSQAYQSDSDRLITNYQIQQTSVGKCVPVVMVVDELVVAKEVDIDVND